MQSSEAALVFARIYRVNAEATMERLYGAYRRIVDKAESARDTIEFRDGSLTTVARIYACQSVEEIILSSKESIDAVCELALCDVDADMERARFYLGSHIKHCPIATADRARFEIFCVHVTQEAYALVGQTRALVLRGIDRLHCVLRLMLLKCCDNRPREPPMPKLPPVDLLPRYSALPFLTSKRQQLEAAAGKRPARNKTKQ